MVLFLNMRGGKWCKMTLPREKEKYPVVGLWENVRTLQKFARKG